jgi:hypothetical protein
VTTTQTILAFVGTLAGLGYAALGAIAERHVLPTEGGSRHDKLFQWSLWWWVERQRYTPAGRRLCDVGGVLFALASSCWVFWYLQGA